MPTVLIAPLGESTLCRLSVLPWMVILYNTQVFIAMLRCKKLNEFLLLACYLAVSAAASSMKAVLQIPGPHYFCVEIACTPRPTRPSWIAHCRPRRPLHSEASRKSAAARLRQADSCRGRKPDPPAGGHTATWPQDAARLVTGGTELACLAGGKAQPHAAGTIANPYRRDHGCA